MSSATIGKALLVVHIHGRSFSIITTSLGSEHHGLRPAFGLGGKAHPFVHECIFYLSANPDNVRRIAELLEQGVTVEQIPFQLEMEKS